MSEPDGGKRHANKYIHRTEIKEVDTAYIECKAEWERGTRQTDNQTDR